MQHERFWRWFPWAVLALYVLPQWICGENAQLVVHDMLDSEVAHRTLLAKSGMLFTRDPEAIVPSILGGVPRGTLPSGYKLDAMLYAFLPPYFAWSVHDTLVRAVALAGAIRLAEAWTSSAAIAEPRHAIMRRAAVAAASIGFALSPWYSVCGLYIAGQPWLVWSWTRLYEGHRNWLLWLVWPIFAMWSSFAIFGPVLLITLGLYWLVRAYRERTIHWAPALALVLYLATAVFVDWPLIALTAKGFDHHRNAWDAVALAKPFLGALGMASRFLLKGQVHAPTYPLLGGLLLVGAIASARSDGPDARARLRSIAPAIAMLLVIALIHLLWQWRAIATIRQPYPPLRFIQFDRFYLFALLPWLYLTARLGASFSHRNVKWLLCLSPMWWFMLSPTWGGLGQTIAHQVGWTNNPPMTFRQFVSADLFDDMKSAVHPTRVASLGMHPAVAQINGLWTADGYLQMYSRTYKERFRRVIARGLARPDRKYWYLEFDPWGSQAYIGNPTAKPPHDIEEIDTKALCDLEVDHVLTNGPVRAAQAARAGWELRFQGSRSDAAWNLHAYRLPCKP